jgi:hypothetical protein
MISTQQQKPTRFPEFAAAGSEQEIGHAIGVHFRDTDPWPQRGGVGALKAPDTRSAADADGPNRVGEVVAEHLGYLELTSKHVHARIRVPHDIHSSRAGRRRCASALDGQVNGLQQRQGQARPDRAVIVPGEDVDDE